MHSRKASLKLKDVSVSIREEDIVEKFIKASGPGGQFVNKTSSCVYLKHLPTGIEVKCQKERSQALNRYIARKILTDKVRAYKLKQIRSVKEALEKTKRSTRPRPARLKRKILEDKRKLSQKKRMRFKVIDLQ
ncbi:MAG: peptide chain release factor-like protein [Candidatus Omnitrophota bacterium]|jgi:protein subunit release factor B